MRNIRALAFFLTLFSVAACASFRVAGDVQAGRQALLIDNTEQALAYFQRAVERDPNYLFISDAFRESVWTYLGRAQYRAGRFREAQESFQRAFAVYPDDFMARLYLGLTLARLENRSDGLRETQAGLKAMHEWLEYMQVSRAYTAYWDPLRQIRSEIEKGLDTVGGKDVDWPKLIESAEWIGQQMEIEVDRVRQDERRFRDREFDRDRPGVGIGIGIGVGF
jgi:tetratricopeptide (TPR) repeat protein